MGSAHYFLGLKTKSGLKYQFYFKNVQKKILSHIETIKMSLISYKNWTNTKEVSILGSAHYFWGLKTKSGVKYWFHTKFYFKENLISYWDDKNESNIIRIGPLIRKLVFWGVHSIFGGLKASIWANLQTCGNHIQLILLLEVLNDSKQQMNFYPQSFPTHQGVPQD